jgi:cold shock CspA family protein
MSIIERNFGRVKWFNNKAGYGFITVIDGSKVGSELFVHHSSIQIAAEQYKYLVQGEYVEFTLSAVATGNHESQAADVTGIRHGLLMCETRALAMDYSQSHHQEEDTKTKTKYQKKAAAPAAPATPATAPATTPAAADEGGEWKPASKRPPTQTQGRGGRGPQGRGAQRGGRGGRGAQRGGR